MADIKERRKDVGSIKEKHTSVPKELLKQEAIHSIQWARQQVQEAAEPEQESSKGAGAEMPRLSISQVKKHPKVESQHGLSHGAFEKHRSKNEIMSTNVVEESHPIEFQGTSAHAQEQGRKLAIRQEIDKTVRIKELTENITLADSVEEPHTGIDPPATATNSVWEHTYAPSIGSTKERRSGLDEAQKAPPKSIKSADQYKHSGVKDQPRTIKQTGQRVKSPEAVKAKKPALNSNHPAKSAAKQTAKATKKGTAKLAKATEKAAVSAVKSIGALLGGSAGLVAVLLVVIVLAAHFNLRVNLLIQVTDGSGGNPGAPQRL